MCANPMTRPARRALKDYRVVWDLEMDHSHSLDRSGPALMLCVFRIEPLMFANAHRMPSLILKRINVSIKLTKVRVPIALSLAKIKNWLIINFKDLIIFVKSISIQIYFFTLGNINAYCKANPKAIKPHPTNCAQFVNCSAAHSRYGQYIQECVYPDLFSADSLSCQKFESVQCIPKNEPQAPCKWKIRNRL